MFQLLLLHIHLFVFFLLFYLLCGDQDKINTLLLCYCHFIIWGGGKVK